MKALKWSCAMHTPKTVPWIAPWTGETSESGGGTSSRSNARGILTRLHRNYTFAGRAASVPPGDHRLCPWPDSNRHVPKDNRF